jgi:hypothetical protein
MERQSAKPQGNRSSGAEKWRDAEPPADDKPDVRIER